MSEPTQETASDELLDTLRLALVPGVGPRLRMSLLERFGTPAAILRAAQSELRQVPRIGAKLAASISRAVDEIDVQATLDLCRERGLRILSEDDEDYPPVLAEIHDPPAVLFLRGRLMPQDQVAVAIVGTRHASSYGLRQAQRLAAGLAREGMTIISGLARGIDAAAHRGALEAGGRTIAVLGSGVLNIYPPEHATLAEEVAVAGCVISESPPLAAPRSGVFPQRNRIISGLTLGTVVVEAAGRSGALITAQHAMEQGREVFAVPGSLDNKGSEGCHRLIRDGARLVTCPQDVLEELGPLVQPTTKENGQPLHNPAELLLNELEQQVLSAISAEPTQIDDVVENSGLPTHRVLATLSVLETRRLVLRLSGTTVRRA